MKTESIKTAIIFVTLFCVACGNENPKTVSNPKDSTSVIAKTDTVIQDSITVNDVAVKSLTKWSCDSNWTKIDKIEEKQFDEKGNMIKWIQYTSDGTICENFKSEYNGTKKTKEYRKYCNDGFEKAIVKILKYGLNDRLEEEIEYQNNKLVGTEKFKYKTNNDKSPYFREYYDSKDKEPLTIAKLSYDKYGNLLEENQITDGIVLTYKYNNSQQLIYETSWTEDGSGMLESYYIYDNNELVKDSVKIPDEASEFHVYETKKLN